jgi:hypothetical protein
MPVLAILSCVSIAFIVPSRGAAARGADAVPVGPQNGNPWLGLTTKDHKSASDVSDLMNQVPALASQGMNVLIWEVDYSFEFQSHPELRYGYAVTKAQARAMAAQCRKYGVKLIPLFNCFGHQSIEDDGPNLPMMAKHPEFDETPGQFPNNQGVYARCWCPLAPGLNRIVFDLLKEIADAFEADYVHVGMDEIFHIGLDSRCKGKKPASLLAGAVREYHDFLRDSCKAGMMMWGDRLIPSTLIGHEWEASDVNTAAAVDSIPKDILICDWHYETSYSGVSKGDYPTVPYFTGRGFRVWPCGFQTVPANSAMIDYVMRNKSDKVLGYLASVWESRSNATLATWQPITSAFSRYGNADATAPGAVVLDPAGMAGNAVSLTWSAPADAESGISGYEVYRDGNDAPTTLLRKIGYNVPMLIDSGVTLHQKYVYRVKAVNRKGLLSATYSNPVSIVAGEATALRGPERGKARASLRQGRDATLKAKDVDADGRKTRLGVRIPLIGEP